MFKLIGMCCKFSDVALIGFLVISVKLIHAVFTENPIDDEEFIGLTAQFECRYLHAVGLNVHSSWVLDNFTLNKVPDSIRLCHPMASYSAAVTNDSKIIVYTLNITAGDECNGTEVHCLAAWSNQPGKVMSETSLPAVLLVRDVHTLEKAALQELANGTILIYWDPLSLQDNNNMIRNVSVTYEVNIINDANGESFMGFIHSSSLTRQSLSYPFDPGLQNQTQCTTFTVFIVPIINHDFVGRKTSLFQEIFPIDSVRYGYVTFIDGLLQFTYSMQMPMPFCNIMIDAINCVNNRTYSLNKTRMDVNSTESDRLMFTVADKELPFDELYTARISVSNYYSSQRVWNPVHLSTHDIQQVLIEESKIVVLFVHHTSAQGAFLICQHMNDSTKLDYIVARKLANDTIEFGLLEPDEEVLSDCDVLLYDLEPNGLFKETAALRPAFVLHEVCILGCELPTSSASGHGSGSIKDDNNTSVTYEEGFIRFECGNISAPNNELLGCIFILHSEIDYTTLSVNTVDKNSTLNISAQAGKSYSYVVFEWKRSGILDSNELRKGTLFIDTTRGHNVTTENPTSMPESDRTTTIVLATIFSILGAGVLILLSIIFSFLLSRCIKSKKVPVTPQRPNSDPNSTELVMEI